MSLIQAPWTSHVIVHLRLFHAEEREGADFIVCVLRVPRRSHVLPKPFGSIFNSNIFLRLDWLVPCEKATSPLRIIITLPVIICHVCALCK